MNDCRWLKLGELCTIERDYYMNKVTFKLCKYTNMFRDRNECEWYEPNGKPSRNIPHEKRYEVCRRQRWRCNICGEKLKYSKNHKYGNEVAHIDHIFPYTKWKEYDGNINELSNLQALCPGCNLKKNKKEIN